MVSNEKRNLPLKIYLRTPPRSRDTMILVRSLFNHLIKIKRIKSAPCGDSLIGLKLGQFSLLKGAPNLNRLIA